MADSLASHPSDSDARAIASRHLHGSHALRRLILLAALIAPAALRAETPPPPDYGQAASWAARGEQEGSAATVAPGASKRRTRRAVDVFYIHPTTDRARDHMNGNISDAVVNDWTDASVIARQAGTFNRCCRIFAPRYRQATLGAGYSGKVARDAAFDLAYGDVMRAFDQYLAQDNQGRPFILVGHSQGAAHLERLLAERIDGTALQKRLVAAYVVGIGLAEGQFGRQYRSLAICDTPRQTGCVVHWNSMLSSAQSTGKAAETVAFTDAAYVARFGDNAGKKMLCVNPLTFDRAHPSAPASVAKGAIPGAPDEKPIRPLLRHAVSARCDDGLLLVEPSADLALDPMANGSMHYHDIGLFYEDVRENADARAQAFIKHHGR